MGPCVVSLFRHLEQGKRYVVVRPFADFDGVQHLVGEAWTFLGTTYDAEGSGRVLHLEVHSRPADVRLRNFRSSGGQGRILARFDEYVALFPERNARR